MSKLQKKTVDEYLNEVDYSWKNYIPSVEAIMFSQFIKEVNDGQEENETPIMHLAMMDSVFNPHPRNAILVHRGGSKTSVFAEYLTLWKGAFGNIPGFGKTNLSLYISDSIENGVKNLRRNVEFRLQNSDYLNYLIPSNRLTLGSSDGRRVELEFYEEAIHDTKGGYRFTDIRLELENRKGDKHITKAFGAQTGVRGTKELGVRPTDATFDDILKGDDAARSAVVVQTVKNTIYKDVAKALHPRKKKMIYLGTPYNETDPLYQAIESGAWTTSVFPICEHFDGRTTKEDFRGSWEDRFPYEYVKDEYDTAVSVGEPQAFYQELMLRVVNKENLLLQEEDIKWYDSAQLINNNKSIYNFFITTDFAVTARESSDDSAISVWAVNEESNIYWVTGFSKKCTIDVSINALFEFVKYYNPYQTGIERSGQQGAIVTMVEKEMSIQKVFFALAREKNNKEAGLNSTVDKVTRFNAIVPAFKMGRIYFPRDMKESKILKTGLNQIRGISSKGYSSAHDDFGDTVAQLSRMKLIPPSVDKPPPQVEKKNRMDLLFEEAESDYTERYSKNSSNINSYLN